VLVLASVILWLPLVTALPLDADGWRTRMLFRDCERAGAQTMTLPDDSSSQGVPPDGWCWI
jgi:hypothetical protein